MRLLAVAGIALSALGSASSRKSSSPPQAAYGAPAPRAMDPGMAVGLWQSSFGAVKIERDPQQPRPELVQGAWTYQRSGVEVVGLFWGELRGNVLSFSWQEPAQPTPLQGGGYLVFDPGGARFDGKWWTTAGDRSGDWSGWREGAPAVAPVDPGTGTSDYDSGYGGYGYGGKDYGGYYGGESYGQPTAPGPPPPPPGY